MVTPKREVPPEIPRPDYANHPTGIPETEMQDRRTNNSIRVYTPEEIQGIREACRIGREVLDIAAAAVRVGVTCDEIDRVVSYNNYAHSRRCVFSIYVHLILLCRCTRLQLSAGRILLLSIIINSRNHWYVPSLSVTTSVLRVLCRIP